MDEMKLIVNERIFGIFLIEESTNSFVNFFFLLLIRFRSVVDLLGRALFNYLIMRSITIYAKRGRGERVAFDRISRHRISRI